MSARQREMVDSMHYESRQIRNELQASHARLKSARSGRLAADLQPQQGALMMQEWEGLSSTGDLDHNNTLASGNPQYEQMRAALLIFEGEMGYTAPARERAFFSALRTQLMESGAQRETEQRNMQIAATFKWFSRHKPQGPEADPITAAVLASSLAVEAVGGPAPPPDPRQPPPSSSASAPPGSLQRLGSPQAHSSTAAAIAAAAAGPGAQSKHHFFDVYTRAPVTHTSATAAAAAVAVAAAAATAATAPAARGAAQAAQRTPGRRSGDGDSKSLSLNHPLAMYPTVSTGHPMRMGLTAAAPPPPPPPASSGSLGGAAPRARFASTDLYAPGKLVRPQELDELDHRAAQVAAAAAAAGVSGASDGGGGRGGGQLHPKPWIPGPHRAPVTALGRGAGPRRGSGEEDEEVKALRSKWSAMEAKTAQSVADVQVKLAEWTLQRARLEEEIVRRQEASRYAVPGGGHSGGAPWPHQLGRPDPEDGSMLAGTLSPYANANADLAAATAAAATSATSVSFMMPGATGSGAMGASMRMRHAEVAMYDRSRTDLLSRLSNLGVVVTGETLDRALRPVEDRPFLDCIARLPKPGEHLVSRPGSVGQQGASKKRRGKSASRKRPTSGR